MMATLSTLPADEADYAFEYKWDGIRAICFADGKSMRFQSRNLLDVSMRYPELAPLSRALGKRRLVLDGEIVALDEHGRPDFNLLQRRMQVGAAGRLVREIRATYMIFDILHRDGYALLEMPYAARRDLLLETVTSGSNWQVPPGYVGEGRSLLSAATQTGLEGIVAKRLTSLYEPGRRSREWLKIKVTQRQEFVIGGWMPGTGAHAGLIGSLLIGYYDETSDGRSRQAARPLHFAGGVGTGFAREDHRELLAALKSRAIARSPFAEKVPRRGAHWVAPELVAEVEFLEWTPAGIVRQPSYKGLRYDKRARDVIREQVRQPA